jgi:hypothetical protein
MIGSRRPTRIDEGQEFHQVLIDWRRRRLDQVDLFPTHRDRKLQRNLAVGEPLRVTSGKRYTKLAGDRRHQCWMRRARKKDDVLGLHRLFKT